VRLPLIIIGAMLLHVSLWTKESLYVHVPSPLPSQSARMTSYGDELLKLIDGAKKEIHFAIYGIRGQDDIVQVLLVAQKRGVKIKGVVDSDSHGKNYYSDTHLLHQHFDVVSDGKSYIMHHKFFIVDKKVLWTGSSNISDTGTGGYNSNSVIVSEDKTIIKLYQKEFDQMRNGKFGIWKEELSKSAIKTKNSKAQVYFSPKSDTYEKGIKPLIQKAKSYIYIPIFYLTHKPLAKELEKAHKRGVDVRIILDASAARNPYSIHGWLREKGLHVKVENFGGKMHNKSMIIDDRFIVGGSMNFTIAGNSKNDENTIVLENAPLAKKYKAYFLTLWESIPSMYLYHNPSPESFESGNSCYDGIDNDFDKSVDNKDSGCR